MFNKKYNYFISYNYKNTNKIGFGSCTAVRKHKLSIQDTNILRKTIEEVNNIEEVVILNIVRLA